MKKVWLRIVVGIVMVTAVIGLAVYEGWMIVSLEHERQMELALDAKTKATLGLNMLKIGVQTEDVDLYAENLQKVEGAAVEIGELGMVREEFGEYLETLVGYAGKLEERKALLGEMRKLKDAVTNITSQIEKDYGNKDAISKEAVKEAKGKVLGLKLNRDDYGNELVVGVLEKVNVVLDKIAEKVGELGDCVDNCYKDKINSLNDELAGVFKEYADAVSDINKPLEAEFDFEKMDWLVGW